MRVTLLVEGQTDETAVWMLLDRAQVPLDELEIRPCQGKDRVVLTARDWRPETGTLAVLVDADEQAPDAAIASLRGSIGSQDVAVFVAVPSIEYWVVGDPAVARALREERTRPRPAAPESKLELLASTIDLERAAALNPSLRDFLSGMQALLGSPVTRWDASPGRKLSREIVAGLLQDLPIDEVAWRTSDGESYTARKLILEVESGSEVGRQYASDLLRVARDLIKRQARK